MNERSLYAQLPFAGARVIELGCGAAEKTRALAKDHPHASFLALEVDEIQHAKNLKQEPMPNVRFELGGAERIPASDCSVDMVFMFKSLHHVPIPLLDQALHEIERVLVPGGLAYFSEPVYDGDYNEILRLFHDEEIVRAQAHAALKRAVDSGRMELVEEVFFKAKLYFSDFQAFENKVLRATHTQHQLHAQLYEEVRSRFASHMTAAGAEFHTPMRVDVLRKRAAT